MRSFFLDRKVVCAVERKGFETLPLKIPKIYHLLFLKDFVFWSTRSMWDLVHLPLFFCNLVMRPFILMIFLSFLDKVSWSKLYFLDDEHNGSSA